MKIAVMQPYLFPYLGYFQLMKAVELFVSYDDVQYIKGGFINRNYLLINGRKKMFSFPLKKDSTYSNINERFFSDDFDYHAEKFLKTVYQEYHKAPFFAETFALITSVLNHKDRNVASFVTNSLISIAQHLSLNTSFCLSSRIPKNCHPGKKDRLLHIIKFFKSNHYINPIGGRELYDKSDFEKEGIILNFIRMNDVTYKQFAHAFVPNLSIVDVLMFNSRDTIGELLEEYTLL